MSITLDTSDFQCLQDQLLDLKNKNYELTEKNRRGQADFEAAKAKICNLQLQLEEQERDFQVTSTTLRREIEVVGACANMNSGDKEDQVDLKAENKKLLLKIEELQQHQVGTTEIMQKMDAQNKSLDEEVRKLTEECAKLKEQLDAKKNEFDVIKKEYEKKMQNTIAEYKSLIVEERKKSVAELKSLTTERDSLRDEVNMLTAQVKSFDAKLESQVEEKKLQDRKGLKMVKELKRQLVLEETKSATLQKRIEQLLSQIPTSSSVVGSDLDTVDASRSRMSTSSSTNDGNGSQENSSSNSRANLDSNSNGSWSFVQGKAQKSSSQALNEELSICSIDSEDRETVQQPGDISTVTDTRTNLGLSESINDDSISQNANSSSLSTTSMAAATTKTPVSSTTPDAGSTGVGTPTPYKMDDSAKVNDSHRSLQSRIDGLKQTLSSSLYSDIDMSLYRNDRVEGGMLLEEQAALVERLTNMQQEKWQLEEKLSYMEQANSSLTEDLANKSEIIRQYFMQQALKTTSTPHSHASSTVSNGQSFGGDSYPGSTSPTSKQANGSNYQQQQEYNNHSRRTSFPTNINHLLSDRPGLKKVVDFLKEKGQLTLGESDNVSKEATRKMQLMLEETLIKCLKLQENLDFVTSELNKLKN